MKSEFQYDNFEVSQLSSDQKPDKRESKSENEPSENLAMVPEANPQKPKTCLRKFGSDLLNWGNIFQSFIGTSILSLPYYCYKAV